MPREMKVFGCTTVTPSRVLDRLDQPKHRMQCRLIVAATSKTAAARLMGITISEYNWTGCDTANQVEIAVAMAEPGVVFAAPLDGPTRAGRFIKVSDRND